MCSFKSISYILKLTSALMMRQEFSRSLGDRLSRWADEFDIVGGVVFAVGTAGAQGVVIALAFVFVRLVPGINANYLRKIMRI